MDFDFDLLLPPSVFHTISVERLVRAERSHASSQGLFDRSRSTSKQRDLRLYRIQGGLLMRTKGSKRGTEVGRDA